VIHGTLGPGGRVADRRWLPELDGWRGIAVGMVLVHHVYPWESFGFPGSHLLGTGWAGVDLFFVLSGFLITNILLDTRDEPGFWSRFAIRRALRILPLYWALMGAILAWRAWAGVESVAPWWAYLLFLSNWWIARMPEFTDIRVNVSWSLAIEEQFYLTFPALVRWLPAPLLAATIGAAIVLAPVARWWVGGDNHLPSYVLTPCRMDAIAWGCAAALAWRAGGPWVLWPVRAAGPLLVVLLGLLVLVGLDRDTAWYRIGGYSLFAATCAAVLLAVVTGAWPRASRLLCAEWLRWLGRVSFGLYLLHPVVFRATREAAVAWIAPWSDAVALLVFPFLAVGLTCGAAALSWRVLEEPVLRLKDRLAPYDGRPVANEPVTGGAPSSAPVPPAPLPEPRATS
jgi:peptidoglycan/LPS O-acetylase OafA/YrhL